LLDYKFYEYKLIGLVGNRNFVWIMIWLTII